MSLTGPREASTTLVGPSGSGKSTVARSWPRALGPAGGDSDARRGGPRAQGRRRHASQHSVVFQDDVPVPRHRGREHPMGAVPTRTCAGQRAWPPASVISSGRCPTFDTVVGRGGYTFNPGGEAAHLHRPRAAEGTHQSCSWLSHQLARSPTVAVQRKSVRRAEVKPQDRDIAHRLQSVRDAGNIGVVLDSGRVESQGTTTSCSHAAPVRRPLGRATAGPTAGRSSPRASPTLGPPPAPITKGSTSGPVRADRLLPRARASASSTSTAPRLRAAVATVA